MSGTPSVAVTLTLRTIAVPIGWYPRLAHGATAERLNFRVSGAGYGIHWPDLDEDIGVEGLLSGKKSTESPASFQQWLQRRGQGAQVGRAGPAE
jgi:hypothetical protein